MGSHWHTDISRPNSQPTPVLDPRVSLALVAAPRGETEEDIEHDSHEPQECHGQRTTRVRQWAKGTWEGENRKETRTLRDEWKSPPCHAMLKLDFQLDAQLTELQLGTPNKVVVARLDSRCQISGLSEDRRCVGLKPLQACCQ